MSRKPLIRFCWILFCVLGCSPQSDLPAKQYFARLTNILGKVDVESGAEPATLRAPRERARLIAPPPTDTLAVREFMSLQACRIHALLAHRNSQLGRMQPASQRLINSLAVIEALPACIDQLSASNPSLATKLTRLLKAKRDNLTFELATVFIAGAEYERLFSMVPRDQYSDASLHATLKWIAEFVDDPNSVKAAQLETKLQSLVPASLGSDLNGVYLSLYWLGRANKILEAKLAERVCLQPNPTQEAKYFQNLIEGFFTNTVQVELAKVLRRHQSSQALIANIESRFAKVTSVEFKRWQAQRRNLGSQLKEALKQHVQLIQNVYNQCGLRLATNN